MTQTYRLFSALFLLAVLAGCGDDPVSETAEPVAALVAEDVPADPLVGTDPVTGRPVGTGRYTFYSLRENAVVPSADSASTAWDLALRGTSILVNGGTSGPGDGAAAVVARPFAEVAEAPADTAFATDADGAPAIPTGSGGGWYNYNPTTHVVTPVPGRTLVVRTADGRYAKVSILSYYQGRPETIDETSASRYYSFEYVFQPDGSRRLQAD